MFTEKYCSLLIFYNHFLESKNDFSIQCIKKQKIWLNIFFQNRGPHSWVGYRVWRWVWLRKDRCNWSSQLRHQRPRKGNRTRLPGGFALAAELLLNRKFGLMDPRATVPSIQKNSYSLSTKSCERFWTY